MHIRPMTPADAPAVLAVYADGIATHDATFDTEPGTWEAFDKRFRPECRLVAEENGEVMGWAVLSATSTRHVYRGVAEVSLYVGAAHRGKGVGRALMAALIEASESEGFWTLQGHIFPENEASVALHAAFGFKVIGTRERFGLMESGPLKGQWRDVVLMERRSKVVGAD
jgi:phosphinothricin acetyltransferase